MEKFDEHLFEKGHKRTINIESCFLHIVHGAFQTGATTTGWQINKVLKAMFKIFDESHAPRGVYSRKGTSFRFPMKFYETRWIEDMEVSERALKIWDLIGCHSHILGMSMEVQTTKEQQKL